MRKTLGVLLAAALAGLASTPAMALEQRSGARQHPSVEYGNQNNGKRVWVLGDSITDDSLYRRGPSMQDRIGWVFVGSGRSVHIDATSGSTISDHFAWNTIQNAANSNARAVIVELGTNDVGLVQNWDQENLAINYMRWAAATLATSRKCILWIGLNGNGNYQVFAPGRPWFDNPIWATVFNQNIQTAGSFNFQYADYTSFVNWNPTYRAGLLDTVHPVTEEAKNELVKWYSALLAFKCGF